MGDEAQASKRQAAMYRTTRNMAESRDNYIRLEKSVKV